MKVSQSSIIEETLTTLAEGIDLTVFDFAAPAKAEGGDEIDLSWTVTNQGTKTTQNSSWYDVIYLSVDTDLDPYDFFLESVYHDGRDLAPQQSYTVDITTALPIPPTPGGYYLLAITSPYHSIEEVDKGNNVKYLPIIVTLPDKDLVVSSVAAPPIVEVGKAFDLSWTVTNQGTEATTSSWYDVIYLSEDEIFDERDTLLASEIVESPIEPGQSYTKTISSSLYVPSVGNYYLLVFTDGYNYEAEIDGTNNVKSFPITVNAVDLEITAFDFPQSATAGDEIEISWTVTNLGTVATDAPSWIDVVYLYTGEGRLPPGGAIVSYEVTDQLGLPLEPGESYTVTTTVKLSDSLTIGPYGGYYLSVRTDASEDQVESGYDGSFGNSSGLIDIDITTPLKDVDLVVSNVSAPRTAEAGSTINLSWTVTNQGSERTNATFWNDYVWLSKDSIISDDDIYLTGTAQYEYPGELPLEAGESYTINQSVSLANYLLTGDYHILFASNTNNSLKETNLQNNLVAVPFTVTAADDVDLVVTDASAPTTAKAGSIIDLSWTVTNQGSDLTRFSNSTDYVLLSTDLIVDFFPYPNKDIDIVAETVPTSEGEWPLTAGESYTINKIGYIPNDVTVGNYYLLFISNIYDAQVETDRENNVIAVPITIVQEVVQGTADADLLTGTDRGESIEAQEGRDRVTANAGDDLITGGTGGDTIIGGAGADRLIYRILQDMGDTITDFTVNEDKIDISELLDSFSYQGSNPVTDGYLRWVQGANGTSVQVDVDGLIGRGIFRPFIFLENVAASDLSASDFIV